MKYPSDLSGIKFGKLTVIEKIGVTNEGKRGSRSVWLCECECGNKKEVERNRLTTGNTKSCGCLEHETKVKMHTKHGMAKTRLWNIWCGMKDRCYRKNNQDYSHYGGRGITVCEEWREDFQKFSDWSMANGYAENLTIDRINTDGNYEPSNCRWATRKEQTRNRRNTVKISLGEIAEIDGISYQEAYNKYVLKR